MAVLMKPRNIKRYVMMKTSLFASLSLFAVLSAAPAFADDTVDEGTTVSDGTGAEGEPVVVSETDDGVTYDPQIAESGPMPNQRSVNKPSAFESSRSTSYSGEDDGDYKTIKRNGKYYKIRIKQ